MKKIQKKYKAMTAWRLLKNAVRCGDRLVTNDAPGASLRLSECGSLSIEWNDGAVKLVESTRNSLSRYEKRMTGVKK